MSDVEIGQVLALKIRYNNRGDIATAPHPYLVMDVDNGLGVLEIAQMDSLRGKEYKAAMRSNKIILHDNPVETVIDRDSYIQLDNTIKVENFPELARFRRQRDKLSQAKLEVTLRAYRTYHATHEISENKNVYMDKAEILSLNL